MMMHPHLLATAYGSRFSGAYGHRCPRCGQGPILGSDGFFMVHCFNCGTYHGGSERVPVDLGLGRLFAKVKGKFALWLKQRRETDVGIENIGLSEMSPEPKALS